MINIAIFGASVNYGGTKAYIMTLYKLLDPSRIKLDLASKCFGFPCGVIV